MRNASGIIGTVHSLWTWLWGRYHVPQNAFLVYGKFLKRLFRLSVILTMNSRVETLCQQHKSTCQQGRSQRGGDMGACPRHRKSIFVTAPLVFSGVSNTYSALGPRWGLPTSVPRSPGSSPFSKFLARPLHASVVNLRQRETKRV